MCRKKGGCVTDWRLSFPQLMMLEEAETHADAAPHPTGDNPFFEVIDPENDFGWDHPITRRD